MYGGAVYVSAVYEERRRDGRRRQRRHATNSQGSPSDAAGGEVLQPQPPPVVSAGGSGSSGDEGAFGASLSPTVHRASAGDGSALPARSTARARRTCAPTATVNASEHGANGASSKLHSKRTFDSVDA